MRSTFAFRLIIILLAVAQFSAGLEQTGVHDSSLRGASGSPGKNDSSSPTNPAAAPREHVIRRVYGEKNQEARKAIHEVENRHPRFQTGLPSDPNRKVNYLNHPYENGGRRLADEETDEPVTDLFKNIRIQWDTSKLDEQRNAENANQVDFVKNYILPRTGEFWQQALSVVPVQGNLFISTRDLYDGTYCGDPQFASVPATHIANGIQNADVVMYVSGTQYEPSGQKSRFCSGNTLAVAVACDFDQFDRPIAGAINFCLDQIELDASGSASEPVIVDNVDVGIHEVAHVLGMSTNSFRAFRDPNTGEPRTPRPFPWSTVTCVDSKERREQLPAENTLKFFLANNGQRFASIVTEKVAAVTRNQFNCPALAGAQLENQPTGLGGSCTGDHWDERLFYPESLSAVISPTTNVLSHVTLALFEDSGWYKANYTMGKISPWGLGAGCSFATDPCLIAGPTPTIPDYSRGYFCNKKDVRGCSPALTHKLSCHVIDYLYHSPNNLPPQQFQYFINDVTMGGSRRADFCPVFSSTYDGKDTEQLSCEDTNNVPAPTGYEVFGESSKCFETSFQSGIGLGGGRCYETACVKDEMKLKVRVNGQWLTCDYDFQELTVETAGGFFTATVTCPRLSTACPDLFCPFNCAGRGTCNFSHVDENGVVRPKCECFDSSDTSEGCSDSLVLDGSYVADSSGLVDRIGESIFDSLGAVFLDPPDKWRTASWAWAAGLLALFLIMLLCICSAFWPSKKKYTYAPPSRARSY